MIRAKFRCLEINLRWDYSSVVKLMPVTRRKYGEGEGMNFKENEQFWKYSPSGECFLHFKTTNLEKIPFRIGSYYYIDMEPDDAGCWSLDVSKYWGADGAGEVEFNRGYQSKDDDDLSSGGSLKIGVSGESAKVETFGRAGKKWNIVFSLAHDHSIES